MAKNSFTEVTAKLNPEGRMEVFQMDRVWEMNFHLHYGIEA